MREFSNHAVLSIATRQWRSHQNTHKTFPSKSFSLRFLLNGFSVSTSGLYLSYIVALFAGLHELASANAGTVIKLASTSYQNFPPGR